MHDFDGTNPLLEALGDEAAIKEIAVTNTSPFIIVEPLTQVRLLPFEKTVIRVKGKAAYEQITANIKQLNALKSEVLSIEVSEPEDDLDSLPWLSSQDQTVFLSMQLMELKGGLQPAGVGTVVIFKYTNQNTEKLRAKIGFHIGGIYSDKEVVVEVGGGEWEFIIPERGDYPDGDYPIEFKYGGEDLLNTAFCLALVPFFARPYPWVAAGDAVVIHGVLGADSQPLHAAKYGDQIFIDVTTAIAKPSRMAISLAGIDGDYETVIFPGRDRMLFILPERVETGDAAKTILIKGEAGEILGNIPVFNIMNAAVDESSLEFGEFNGFFASGVSGTSLFPAHAMTDWTQVSLTRKDGRGLEEGSADDAFPRTFSATEGGAEPGFDIRKSSLGAPNGYAYEVRLKDGSPITAHKPIHLNFTANPASEHPAAKTLDGSAYVSPDSLTVKVFAPQANEWTHFGAWSSETPLELTDEAELSIRMESEPEGWMTLGQPKFTLASATGEEGISIDAETGKITFASPAVVEGAEANHIEIQITVQPEGIAGFAEFDAFLVLRRTA